MTSILLRRSWINIKANRETSRDISVPEKELTEETLGARKQPKQDVKEECHYVLLLTKDNTALRILQMRTAPTITETIFVFPFPEGQDVCDELPIPSLKHMEKRHPGTETVMDMQNYNTVENWRHWAQQYYEMDDPTHRSRKPKQLRRN